MSPPYSHSEALAAVRRARRLERDEQFTDAGNSLGEELARTLFEQLPDLDRETISRVALCLAVQLTFVPPTITARTVSHVVAIAADVLDAGTEAPR